MVSLMNRNQGNGQGVILLATDGSKPALMATKKAIELALAFGSMVHTVCVHEELPTTSLERLDEAVHEEQFMGIHAHGNMVAQEYGRIRGVEVVTHTEETGPVVAAILGCAKKLRPDMIVIGNSGRSGWERISLGSVAEGVMKHSPFPVVMTKGIDEAYIEDILTIAQKVLLPTVEEVEELISIGEVRMGRAMGLSLTALLAFLIPYFGLGIFSSFWRDVAIEPVLGSMNVALLWILMLFPMGWLSAIAYHLMVTRREEGRA